MKKNYKSKALMLAICLFCLLGISYSCSKFEYRTIEEPAYLRVFNCLYYKISAENPMPTPYLTMLIDPQFDQNGIPIGAAIVGDFMDTRRPYAPPFPNYTGNVSKTNYDYPGNADVLVAPIMNGYNLSGWAQVPAGEHRVMFVFRPKNEVPFAELEERFRKQITVDTTFNLSPKEVYTMNVLQADFTSKKNMAYLRQETFYKQGFDTEKIYFNVYNLSSKGYWKAPNNQKDVYPSFHGDRKPVPGIQDEMNIYTSLYDMPEVRTDLNNYISISTFNKISGFENRFAGKVFHDLSGRVTPYHSIPLFINKKPGQVWSNVGVQISLTAIYTADEGYVNYDYGTQRMEISCIVPTYMDPYKNSYINVYEANELPVTTHSGTNKKQSFATVNSIEVVNGKPYITSTQRTFPKPIF